ncbi:hypothetical protein ILUMI_03481 [Ignelater luminosus]|uniref:Uncharacterized protein n=1 Tax=Ignelater luminosus TaxID=2038154 RepID=A0A8K0DFQ5_IGNLU|nr:hypothetical protein ILUMI_03481 [Ignelater luminosus]
MDRDNFSKQSTPCTPTKRNVDSETDQIDSEYVTPKKCVKQHLQTKQHKSKLEMKGTSGLLEKFLDSSSASTSSESSFCSDKENVAAELVLTYHTVKHKTKETKRL